MNDDKDKDKDMESDEEIPVKKVRRKKQASSRDNTKKTPAEKIPLEKTPMEETPIDKMLSQLIAGSVDKYSRVVDKQYQETRNDFDCLQPILTEFLDDFLIIGHTLEGQRLVMRYADSPIQLDALTELSKKVLVRMLMQEQSGDF
jgi:hypothetical protein